MSVSYHVRLRRVICYSRTSFHTGCVTRCVFVQVNGRCVASDDEAPVDICGNAGRDASRVKEA